MKILLDTNFLLVPAQFKVDIFDELRGNELITLNLCIRELNKISKGKGRAAEHAKIALALVRRKKIKIIRALRPTDTALLNYAKDNSCAVATNDRKLIKTLKTNKIKIIRLRQKRYMVGL